jgi:hypothetical protein
MMHADDMYATIRDRQRDLQEEAAAAAARAPVIDEPVLTLPAIALAWQVADLLDQVS